MRLRRNISFSSVAGTTLSGSPPKQYAVAKALGAKLYFTGWPCCEGHLTVRYVTCGCVECAIQRVRRFNAKHRDEVVFKRRKRYFLNKAAHNERMKKWRQENRVKARHIADRARRKKETHYRAKAKLWRSENIGLVRSKSARYRARKTRATPPWLTITMKDVIEEKYRLANWCAEETGISRHVDHIIPLHGLMVCGLHVP